MTVEIVEVDLERPEHQRDVLAMTQAYARDPMGNGAPLSPEVAARLLPGLRAHPTTVILLAYLDGQAAGIATCFRGFSTFYAQPTINIHDLSVLREHRGAGIGRRLLEAVAAKARALGCCKLTLEVQENNARARRLYESFGFRQAVYVESAGGVLYYTRTP